MTRNLDTVKRLCHHSDMDASASPPRPESVKDALIAAGLALLEQSGPESLTLRKVAALAGVSHAAPAHHFNGISGLLTAMAAQAFDLFTATMVARRDAAGSDPFARLCGICDGYVDFARDHGGYFHLMFLRPNLDRCDLDLAEASGHAFAVLRNGCLPFTADGHPDPSLETGVWSLVHGYASLGFADAETRAERGETDSGLTDILRRFLDGPRRKVSDANPLASGDQLQ